jgi:hypothetical protein
MRGRLEGAKDTYENNTAILKRAEVSCNILFYWDKQECPDQTVAAVALGKSTTAFPCRSKSVPGRPQGL